MITDTLISATQIQAYRPTAVLDSQRITPFILEAQEGDLRPVLNDVLYYDLMTNFTDTGHAMYALYQDLIVGTEWTYNANTIYFPGIRPMLAYYTLARFVINNPVNISRFGIVQKVNPQSEPVSGAELRAVVNDLKSTALNYQNDLVKFLTNNIADYPLYNTGGTSNPGIRTTSFNFFKA